MEIFTTKLGKYVISYYSSKEFHSLKREIFSENIYDFHLDSESPIIVDIGSNIGLSVLYFKSKCPNSQIFAFEPNPYTFKLLEKNIFENNIEGVTLVNKAIAVEKGKKTLYIDSSENLNYSTSSFVKGAWNKSEQIQEKVEVECLAFKDVFNTHIDLMKIDIEGYEYQLLSNTRSILDIIDNLIIEYHPTKREIYKKFLTLLVGAGYRIETYIDGKIVKEPVDKKLIILKCFKNGRNF